MCMSCVSLAGGWVDRVDGLESGHGQSSRCKSSRWGRYGIRGQLLEFFPESGGEKRT